MLPALDVDPVLGPAGLIRSVAVLRHEPVKAELVGRAEEIRADLAASNGLTKMPSGRRAGSRSRLVLQKWSGSCGPWSPPLRAHFHSHSQRLL